MGVLSNCPFIKYWTLLNSSANSCCSFLQLKAIVESKGLYIDITFNSKEEISRKGGKNIRAINVQK